MLTPTLRPLPLSAARSAGIPVDLVADDAVLFEVTRPGVRGDQRFDVGEVVVAAGRPATGDAVLLVPMGRGRPMFGRITDGVVCGDAGEARHPARWQVAGSFLGVVRQAGPRWVLQLQSGCEVVPLPAARQLSLFAA